MDYFEDFSNDDEIVENFNTLRQNEDDFVEYTLDNIQFKHKSQNQFVFESFATKLKKLKIRLNQNIDKDLNLMELNNEDEEKKQLSKKNRVNNEELTFKEEDEMNLIASNFKSLLEKEKMINARNPDFLNLYNKLSPFCFSYLYLINNYKKIFDIIKEEISIKYKEKVIEGIFICFDLLIALIKDVREECYNYFVENNLEQIVKIVKIDQNYISDDKKFHLIDNVFTFFVNIFKFLEKAIQKNFKKLFIIYSELLFNNNKYIRLFACQSLCYIIKNLNKDDVNETFNFLFDIMLNPNQLFQNEENLMQEEIYNENACNDIINNILSDNKKIDSKIKIMICDSISELLSEVLINIKTLSIKADLILFKLNQLSDEKKNNINIIIIFAQTFIKLIKKINQKTYLDVLSLFHFFIINFYYTTNDEKEIITYQKMKILNLNEQLSKIKEIQSKNNFADEKKFILLILIFLKELLLKNFKDTSRTYSDYINEFISMFKNDIFGSKHILIKSYLIEISCLLLKFHSDMNLNYNLTEFLINNEGFLKYFLELCLNLNSFPFFQSFSLYSFRSAFDKISNDEYNTIEYDKNKFEEILNEIINNEKISYDSILNIINYTEKIFDENLNIVLIEEKQKNMIINYIRNNTKINLKEQIRNLNEENYNKIKKLIYVCKMINNEETTKFINENIIQEIYNIFNEYKKDIEQNEVLNNILLNDFYCNSKHYVNKKECLLDLVLYCNKNKNEKLLKMTLNLLQNNENILQYYPIYYSLLENFDEKNLNKHFIILLTNKNKFKNSFVNLYKKHFIQNKGYNENQINILNELFSIIANLLQNNINLTYDKKYSISFEIIVSKLELLLSNEGLTKSKLEILSFVLWFIFGSYWISLTKSVWPILNKMLNQIFTILINCIHISKYDTYKDDIIIYIMNPLNNIINFIQKYPSESDFISKNNNLINENYIILSEKDNYKNKKNDINILTDEYKTISTFFIGLSTGLIDSYNILLNEDEFFRDNYIENIFINTCAKFDTEGLLIIKDIIGNNNEKIINELNILFNYIYDKESKSAFSNTIFKLKENLFCVMTKIENLSSYKNYEIIKEILFNQIIFSRSILIQKYSIDIFALFDSHVKNYIKLLKEIIDNTSVIIKVNNIENILDDNNQLINEEDREKLIPIMTRLYYSKYFNIKNTEFSATTKKVKTKNKINLLNYFIQLRQKEFDNYIKIIFEPINKELFFNSNKNQLNYALINIRTLKKILEILKINLKQITKLFEENNSIENISNLIINCFIFMKKLGQQIKHNKIQIINDSINYIQTYSSNKIHNYFNKEEFEKFFDFMHKNIKEIKKSSLSIFVMIFNKFYTKEKMITNLSQQLLDEYKENLLNNVTLKANSIFKFFLSLSRHAKLHYIYTLNDNEILVSIFNSLKNSEIERSFIFNIVDFFENIVSPYGISEINEIEKEKNEYVEIMDLDDDESDDIKNDIPISHEELINNFKKIIINNFNEITISLTALIFNGKISATIKDNLTLKIIELLLSLWSLYTNTNVSNDKKNYKEIKSANELMQFILSIIKNDKKIYKNKNILDNVLKLLHILILIKINNEDLSNEKILNEVKSIYSILIHLIYKLENFNSRLLLSIILKEFSFLDKSNKLLNVLEILIKLNTNKNDKRELGKELDNDLIINIINEQINDNFINENIEFLEPLIYQLLILSSSSNVDDFSLNSTSLDKLKQIFKYISFKAMHKNLNNIFETLYTLLKNNFVSYGKIIYESFYEINSVNQSETTGKDLYELEKNKENNFFTNILNFNIDKRIDALKLILLNLENNKKIINENSIINFVIPLVLNILNYKNYSEISSAKNKKNFIIKNKNESIKEIILLTQKILSSIIEYPINQDKVTEILLFLFNNLKKISKNYSEDNESNNNYSIDVFKMTNESLTLMLESIIKIYFNSLKFNEKLIDISNKEINTLDNQILENDLDLNEKEKEENINDFDNNKNFSKKNLLQKMKKNNTFVLISTMYNNIFKQLNNELIPQINSYQNNNANLYEILSKEIYPTLKSLLYIDEKRESKNHYYIRNYIIIPYIQLLKLLPPTKIQSELIQLIIELINNLSSNDAGVRSKTRDGIKNYITNLNEVFIIKFFECMKSSLNSGYQRHIFAYTVNFLLQFVTNYKICEISLNLIMPILFDELFGELSDEKEIGKLVNKYKEAKENKGLNSMELIGKNISIKFLIIDLVNPMKNYLMIRKNNSETTQKVNEVIIALTKGIKQNPLIKKENTEIINDMLDYGYILIHLGVEKNQKNLKEIKKLRNVEIKGNDIYTVDFKNLGDNPYVIEVANKFIEEKNEIIYSNLFAVLGLEFFITILKNKIFNFSEIEKNSEIYEKLNNILEIIFSCMKMTNNTVVVSKSIKIIISMITENEKFFVIKKNLNKITKNLFKIILSINSGDTTLAQSVLSAISSILTKFNFITVSDSQIKTLLSFLKLNIFNSEIKPYVFNNFYSLITKKILHPDIYDMINYMREIYLKSFDDNTITICKKIFFDFINNYPLENKGRLNHLNYFINNCEKGTRQSQLNSIDMLINFSDKKNFEGIKENLDFLIMKMFTLYSNSEDNELKTKIEELLSNLYENYNGENNFKIYYEKALNIIENNENNDAMKIFGIIILSLILNLNINFIDMLKVIKILNKILKDEIQKMNKFIENKMNNYDYLIEKENNIKIKNNNDIDWNISYQTLVCIEKIFNIYIIKNSSSYKIQKNDKILYKNLFDNIINLIIHPHSFIKSIILRLISNIIINSDFYILSESQLKTILPQINIITLSNPSKLFFEEKAISYGKKIILKLITNKNFKKNKEILDFLQNLTNDVKKWISNKGNGLIILQRVIDLFENVVEVVFENEDEDSFYLKPIIELSYRVNNNNLAEESIKMKCESIMENINSKMNKNKLNEVYKEVTKEINLLKQKRKMEQVEKFKKENERKNDREEKKEENDKSKKSNKKKQHQNKKNLKNKKNNNSLDIDDD